MSLLHLSLSASDPKNVATFLARIMGGPQMPFSPFPDSWIAFGAADDGTAIEVYPLTHRLVPGADQIACEVGPEDDSPSFCHAAIGSVMPQDEILALAADYGWLARICNRGPFHCIEVWIEGRILIEVLDADMLRDYRQGMIAQGWADMFGFDLAAG